MYQRMNATSDQNIGRPGGHIEREGHGHMETAERVGSFFLETKGVFRAGLFREYLISMTFGNTHALEARLAYINAMLRRSSTAFPLPSRRIFQSPQQHTQTSQHSFFLTPGASPSKQ